MYDTAQAIIAYYMISLMKFCSHVLLEKAENKSFVSTQCDTTFSDDINQTYPGFISGSMRRIQMLTFLRS